MNKLDLFCIIMAAYFKPFFIFGIIVTMCCMEMCDNTDPMDVETMETVERYVGEVECLDKNEYGFTIHYKGSKPISPERADEMWYRKEFLDMQERLKRDVAIKFPDLSNVDIYEFAYFVRKYDSFSKDYRIESIFVAGETKSYYMTPNPKLEGYAQIFNMKIGMLYIDELLIYGETNQRKVYKYFKARYPWDKSFKDERFTHVTQEEVMRDI